MSQTLEQILEDAKQELRDYIAANSGQNYAYYIDEVTEIADSSVPIYTGDLIALASDNYFLMNEEPEIGPAFDGNNTPLNLLAANVYEYIYNALYSYLDERMDELEEQEEEE